MKIIFNLYNALSSRMSIKRLRPVIRRGFFLKGNSLNKFLLISSLTFFIACGGVRTVNTGIHIPDIDAVEANDSYYEEGWQALKEGNPKIALQKFQQSTVNDEKLYVAYGYALLSQNKYNLARRNFNKALELNSENLQAEFGLATIYELMNDKERAFTAYSRLLAMYPENAWVKIRYQNIKSTETQYYLNKAEQHNNENKTEKYIEALKSASRYSPEIIEIKIKIADFYEEEGQYEQAVAHYEKVLSELPNKEDILVKLAKVYERMEKIDAAIMIYKTMLQIKPGDLTIINKINDLKIKFYESDLPAKFKEIFFKKVVSREDLAALLGFYFKRYLEDEKYPVIIRDISGSYAKEYIIKICTTGIMGIRPDHSFDRFSDIKRASFAVVLDNLLKYLHAKGKTVKITPLEEVVEPGDISPLHRNYKIIKFLVNTRIMKLDFENKFNGTETLSPADVINSIKKILYNIE
jgi:tetratricopeptide (TPR) repeat protein